MAINIMTGMTACKGGSPNDEPTPKVTISLTSCSITEGAEYEASELTEVKVTYNDDVTVSSYANIKLGGTRCKATSSATTATEVIITLPTLEEGKMYTLTIPKGAIISKKDNTVFAPDFSVTFATKEMVNSINNDATALTKRLGWGWNLGNHFDTSTGQDGDPFQWGYWDNAKPTQALYTNLKMPA